MGGDFESLKRRIRDGDRDSANQFCLAYLPFLLLRLRVPGISPEDREEWATDIVFKVFSFIASGKLDLDEEGLLAYLKESARNRIRGYFRALERAGRRIPLEEIENTLQDQQGDALTSLIQGETIHRILMQLPKDVRQTYILHYGYGFTVEDIAELAGVGASAIKMRLSRARHVIAGIIGRELI